MKVNSAVTRYVEREGMVVPFDTLKKAAEEAKDYDLMRVSNDHYVCVHDNKIYTIIVDNGTIGCSCGDMTYRCRDGDCCKHIAAFDRRSEPPQKIVSNEIVMELLKDGWHGEPSHLLPPELTSDEDGEDEPSDPVPPGADKPEEPEVIEEPKLGEKVWNRECTHCGEKFTGTKLDEVKKAQQDHVQVCPKNPSRKETPTPPAPPDEPDTTPEKRTYKHPDGTVFGSAEALLDYAAKNKPSTAIGQTHQDIQRRRHKPMIKGISPRLQEIGRIAVGEKGGKSKSGKSLLPTKLDHFIFTTLTKDEEDRYIRDTGMMAMFGDNCTEIPIRLLYNDIELNFPTFYAKYARSGIKIRGDGENWTVYNGDGTREEVFDPNNERGFLDDTDVKPHGILTALVEGQDSVGGVFKFRTTSWNSINNILSSLALIKNMCGMLTYIPLKLVLRKKEVQPVGMAHKTWIPVVSVEFRGSIEELQTQAAEVQRLTSGTQRQEMKQIEDAVRATIDEDEALDVQQDIASEFAPGVV